MPDFIPSSDPTLDAYAAQAVTTVSSNPAAFGETLASIAALTAAYAAWGVTWPNSVNALAAAASAVAAKNTDREALVRELRALNGRVQARGDAVTPAAKEQAGLPVHGSTSTPVGAPATAPLLQVANNQRLTHVISFRDAANPNRRGKPAGAYGCRLHVKIGSPPVNLDDAEFVTVDTASPYIYEFEPEDAGKIAYWIACWVNPRMEPGPCSETVAATITA